MKLYLLDQGLSIAMSTVFIGAMVFGDFLRPEGKIFAIFIYFVIQVEFYKFWLLVLDLLLGKYGKKTLIAFSGMQNGGWPFDYFRKDITIFQYGYY